MIDRRILVAWTAALVSGAAVFIADQTMKLRFFDQIQSEGAAFSFFNGLVRSTLHHNYGISFNLPLPLVLTLVITGIALGWALALLIERAKQGELLICVIIGMFVGGALGNVYDRLTLGFVRDWLLLFGRSAVNLADAAIAGSLLALIFSSRSLPLEHKRD